MLVHFLQTLAAAVAPAQQPDAALARQQAIYGELLAARRRVVAGTEASTGASAGAAASVQELTRDLSGWSVQWAA